MKYAVIAVRTLLGLTFLVFGLNHFFEFFKMPRPELTTPAQGLMTALYETRYIDLVKTIEVTGGLLLLTGRFVPLGLVLLMPVIVNIAIFDFVLMKMPGLGGPLLCTAIFLIWAYRSYFKPLFTFNAVASSCCVDERVGQSESPHGQREPVAGAAN